MMEAARTSETSVDSYFTRQCIPEDNSELRTRRRENLKSHICFACCQSRHSQDLIFFFAFRNRRTRPVKLDGH
jgi:hypothetical protein